MTLSEQISQAIENRSLIEFRYRQSWRTVEPHALGYNSKGKLTLCAWQVSGGSAEDWRDFHVDLISERVTTPENFEGARSGFNPGDRTLPTLISCL